MDGMNYSMDLTILSPYISDKISTALRKAKQNGEMDDVEGDRACCLQHRHPASPR